MEKKEIKQALEQLKTSPKRKFNQSVDVIISLKDLDLKKPDNHVDYYASLHFTTGKPVKVCGLVDVQLVDQSKSELDGTVKLDEFSKYDKKAAKKLAEQYDYFVAQATIMPKVAQAFGRVFGPRQKMPNPKAGCVVPPNANLKQVKENLQKVVRVQVKTKPMFLARIGVENMKEEELIDNIITLYNSIVHHLPQEKNNIKKVMLKYTMGKPVVIGEASEAEDPKQSKTSEPKKPVEQKTVEKPEAAE